MNLPNSNSLGALANPCFGSESISVFEYAQETLTEFLEKMIFIRMVEEQIAELVKNNEVHCPCHLGVGQEAIAVGIAQHLRKDDRAFGNHRSHCHYLAMGGSASKMIDEIFGKATGCSKGMGGSMHLYAGDVGFQGSVPIVAGTIPMAVGAALAAKLQKKDIVAIAYFGDGACEEGVVHESLNLASIMKLPVIFVVENNMYSSHMDIAQRQPYDSVARFARSHAVESRVVDGNDVIAVSNAAGELIARARKGDGPGFLEGVTYRWLGHVGANHDIDVGVRRSISELDAWKARDPIKRLELAMKNLKIYDQNHFDQFKEKTAGDLERMVIEARNAPWPEYSALLDYVYSQNQRDAQ